MKKIKNVKKYYKSESGELLLIEDKKFSINGRITRWFRKQIGCFLARTWEDYNMAANDLRLYYYDDDGDLIREISEVNNMTYVYNLGRILEYPEDNISYVAITTIETEEDPNDYTKEIETRRRDCFDDNYEDEENQIITITREAGTDRVLKKVSGDKYGYSQMVKEYTYKSYYDEELDVYSDDKLVKTEEYEIKPDTAGISNRIVEYFGGHSGNLLRREIRGNELEIEMYFYHNDLLMMKKIVRGDKLISKNTYEYDNDDILISEVEELEDGTINTFIYKNTYYTIDKWDEYIY